MEASQNVNSDGKKSEKHVCMYIYTYIYTQMPHDSIYKQFHKMQTNLW